MSVFLAVTPAEAASCRGYRVPLVHIAYAVGDGGRLLLLVIEKLRKKPIPAELEGSINLVGFALLMMLVIFVTWREVGALF